MLALAAYERGICQCGFHESQTHDKSNRFTFDEKVCPVCSGSAKYARIQAAQDRRAEEALGEKAPPKASRPSDGRRTYTRLMGPDEGLAPAPRKAHGDEQGAD